MDDDIAAAHLPPKKAREVVMHLARVVFPALQDPGCNFQSAAQTFSRCDSLPNSTDQGTCKLKYLVLRAFNYCESTPSTGRDPDGYLKATSCPSAKLEQRYAEALRRYIRYLTESGTFVSAMFTSKGLIGLVRGTTQPGDQLVHCTGTSWPLISRQDRDRYSSAVSAFCMAWLLVVQTSFLATSAARVNLRCVDRGSGQLAELPAISGNARRLGDRSHESQDVARVSKLLGVPRSRGVVRQVKAAHRARVTCLQFPTLEDATELDCDRFTVGRVR